MAFLGAAFFEAAFLGAAFVGAVFFGEAFFGAFVLARLAAREGRAFFAAALRGRGAALRPRLACRGRVGVRLAMILSPVLTEAR